MVLEAGSRQLAASGGCTIQHARREPDLKRLVGRFRHEPSEGTGRNHIDIAGLTQVRRPGLQTK